MSWNTEPFNRQSQPRQLPGQYNYPQNPGRFVASAVLRPPPPGVDPTLWQWFQAVDQDNSGKITADELQRALLNNNWSTFNSETCRLMIGMFDTDRDGQIDIYEFAALWKFDTDRSGNIDSQELYQALTSFGYRLSGEFTKLVIRVFDRTDSRTILFDAFIQACVMLKGLTDNFKGRDTQRTGVVNINYEQFLEMVLDNNIV